MYVFFMVLFLNDRQTQILEENTRPKFKNKWNKNKFNKAINKPTKAIEVELKKIQTTNIKSKYASVIVLTGRLSYSEELVIHLSGILSWHRRPVLHT